MPVTPTFPPRAPSRPPNGSKARSPGFTRCGTFSDYRESAMIYCRFQSGDVHGWGFVEEHQVHELSGDYFSPFEKTGKRFP